MDALQAASPSVKAIFILDSDGNRVCAKYYDKSYPTQKEQLDLEKKLYAKTKNATSRVEGESAAGGGIEDCGDGILIMVIDYYLFIV